MTALLVIGLIVLLCGGFGYNYQSGGAYPYRGYAFPGVGVIIVVFVVLYLLGVFH